MTCRIAAGRDGEHSRRLILICRAGDGETLLVVRADTLEGADLSYKSLRKADLAGRNLCGTCFRRSNLEHALLQGADLERADLAGAWVFGANLMGARLLGANLRGACLRRARLDCVDLRGADLCGADLAEAALGGALLVGARYDRHTRLPRSLDPDVAGMVRV